MAGVRLWRSVTKLWPQLRQYGKDRFRPARISVMTSSKLLAASALALFAFSPLPGFEGGGARAQLLRPPIDMPEAVVEPAQASDAAAAQLRIDRLENQIRSMTGQIEELQFQIRRLEEQLRKFQQDVDFRFDEQKGAKPGGKPAPAAPAATPRRTDLREPGAPASTARRSDAFDPALDPTAPGAPRDLAAMAPGENAAPPPARAKSSALAPSLPAGPLSAGEEAGAEAPLELRKPAAGVDATASLQVQPAPRVIAAPEAAPQAASLPPAVPASDYDLGTVAFREGRYDVAEERLRSYLDQHPKDRLTPEATFLLGETYLRRARARDAAEQYLKITVDFPRAARAPEALVKLGLSLEKLGAKEQACAAFGEVARKYPAASSAVRVSAERESKRVQC